MTFVAADTSAPARVTGVHGSPGLSWWKALATRRDLASLVEASEWACIAPGVTSGEHKHTRTEEIYVMLKGRGEFILNGEKFPFYPGSLGLTTIGSTHGLKNVGSTNLEWWVVETIPPPTAEVLMSSGQKKPDFFPGGSTVHQLSPNSRLNLAHVFSGPLRAIERIHLRAGQTCEVGAVSVETFVYVTRGAAALSDEPGDSVVVTEGSSAIKQGGGKVHVVSQDATEMYVAYLAIERAESHDCS